MSAPVRAEVPAGPLGEALQRFAAQAAVVLATPPAALQNLSTPGLQGEVTVDAGFAQLLKDSGHRLAPAATGYAVVPALDGTRTVVAATAPATGTTDHTLAAVIVTATRAPVSRYNGVSSQAAARLPADPMDLPVAGVSIPKSVMEDQGIIRAAEAARNVSAVTRTPAYLGLTDSYRIRGFPASTGLWNGFRRDFYYSFTDTAHLERVEVIKGPASVTYGDLEPGGVVNYVTKRPVKNPVNTAQLSLGSEGLVRPEFDVGTAWGDAESVRLRITGAHEKADSFRDFVENQHSTLGATLDWDLTAATRLQLSGYWFDSEVVPDRGFFNSLGPVVLQLPRERFLGEPDDRYTFQQTDVSALLSHRLNAAWSVRGGVNQYQVDDVRDNVQNRDLGADGRTLRRQYTYVPSYDNRTTVFGELRGDLKTGAVGHTLVAGVEHVKKEAGYDFRRDRSSSYAIDLFNPVYNQYGRPRAPQDRYENNADSQSLYLQDLLALGEQWRLLAGLRHTRYEQNDRGLDGGSVGPNGESVSTVARSETTPRLGVVFKATPEQSVFVSYAQSFKPQFNATNLAPGSSRDAEQGEQHELGYKYTAQDERLVAGATLFQIRKQNVATTDPLDADRFVLTGEQRVRGLEFDVNAKLGNRWSLIASYAHLDAVVTRDNNLPVGDQLVNTPRHQASVWVRHDFESLPGFGVGVGGYHVGKREAELPNTWTVPSYTRLDASAYWRVDAKTDLGLHVKNVTNKRYHDSQDNLLYPGAPTNVLVSLKRKF
ncbi:MAG: TonB-dependent siderophore receptor [Pseudomonadota bacterium]